MCKDVTWGDRAEDVILAMDRLRGLAARIEGKKPVEAKRLRHGAMAIQLVISTRLGDVIRLLDATSEASPQDVMNACERVLDGGRTLATEIPLVRIGQGEYERAILGRDLLDEVKKDTLMQRAVAAWRTMRGAL